MEACMVEKPKNSLMYLLFSSLVSSYEQAFGKIPRDQRAFNRNL